MDDFPTDDNTLTIHDHGVFLVLNGPFPDMVVELIEQQKNFTSKRAMLRWLDAFWPDWKEQLIHSEGL